MTQFGPGAPNPRMRPIDHAFLYLGVQEDRDLGPNRGKMIDAWLRRNRLEPDPEKNPETPKGGYAWCSSFAGCMVEDAGYEMVKSASGHRLYLLNKDIEVPDMFLLEEGDVLIHLRPNGTSHVAMWRYRRDGRHHTIDGNSNKQGSREGIEVALCDRPVDYWHKALRPRKPSGRAE